MQKETAFGGKYMLTVRETAKYYGIGENKLRRIIAENPNAPFLLANGNRMMIKQGLFKEYLDSAEVI